MNTIRSSLERIPEIDFTKFKIEKIGEKKPSLNEKWRINIGDPVTKIAATKLVNGEKGFIAGTQNGRVILYNLLCQKEWEYKCSGKVNAISCADINNDKKAEILIGAGDELVVLNQNGEEVWSYKFEKYYKIEGNVQFVYSTDLEGNGESSVICGTDAWHVYAFDPKGEKRWVTEVYAHSTTVSAAVDLDTDGKKEIVVGTKYHSPINVLNSKGKILWRSHQGQKAMCLELADLDGDGRKEVLYGTVGTTQYEMAHLHLFTHDGKPLWKANLGDEATCLTVKDIDEDGLPEIMAGSKSWNLFLLNNKGKIVWRRFLGQL